MANPTSLYIDEQPRRIRRVLVNAAMLVEMFKQTEHPDHTFAYEGMPADARVVGVGVRDDRVYTFYVDVESDTFTPSGPSLMTIQVSDTKWTYDPAVMAAMRAGIPVTVAT